LRRKTMEDRKLVVVGVDGSEDGLRAVKYGASFAVETIGTIGVPDSLPSWNISRENPAPATTRSMPSSIAILTASAKSLAATISLMPMIPLGDSERARRIS